MTNSAMTKVSSLDYDKGWRFASPAQKKEELLRRRNAGEPRPRKGPLADGLKNYCSPGKRSFDLDFKRQIQPWINK